MLKIELTLSTKQEEVIVVMPKMSTNEEVKQAALAVFPFPSAPLPLISS